ncbi:hypothetical protein [Amycolatopsis sp. WAC 01416]|nr:hypothetical protein [Amycolatopsis sp. WAC 01416]
MIANVLPYVFWLVLSGCLIAAAPMIGIPALVLSLGLAAKVGR